MYQITKHDKNNGFTLVELMFSMVFISLLILSITMTIMQVLNIYNRGLLIKEVNQTGRTVTDQMQRTISASIPGPTISVVKMTNPSDSTEEIGGRFCLSNYSYIWNYGKTLSTSVTTANVFATGTPANQKVNFIRVPDVGGSYCQPDNNGLYKKISRTGATEVLSTRGYGLVLYNMFVTSGSNNFDSASSQRLYYIDMTIGTSDYNAIDVSAGRSCKAPSQSGSDQDYCSINSFSFVARAGNM